MVVCIIQQFPLLGQTNYNAKYLDLCNSGGANSSWWPSCISDGPMGGYDVHGSRHPPIPIHREVAMEFRLTCFLP